MYGAIITPPVNYDSDFGIVFMDIVGYWNMSGHASIGVVTAVIEAGIVVGQEPITSVNIDTATGVIKARARVKNGKVDSVTIRNVPSFLFKSETIDVSQVGRVRAEIAFGGNFYAIVSADQIGGVQFCDKPSQPNANVKNLVVSGERQADRSPCGTGTSGLMAMLHSKKQLELNTPFISESIVGATFEGRLISESIVADSYKAVIPEIKGSAYVTGICSYIVDPDDPFKHGFLMP